MPHDHTHGHDHHHHDHDHGHAHGHEPPPTFEDPAQQSLVNALRSSFGILRVLMLVLVVMYLFSGVFKIGPGEQGLIARFGKLVQNESAGSRMKGTPVFEQGWQLALPDPFDQKITITGRTQSFSTATFLFSVRPEDLSRPLSEIAPQTGSGLKPGQDGAMLTGDRNLSHGLWEVEYRIDDADRFVRNVGESLKALEPLLKRLLEAAVVREVAAWRVEDVTRERVDDVRRAVQGRLQKKLDDLQSGLVLVEVRAKTIEPGGVRDAFNEVSRAENEKESKIKEAMQKAVELLASAAGSRYPSMLEKIHALGKAQAIGADAAQLEALQREVDVTLDGAEGAVATRLREARSEASAIHERLTREFEQFTYYLEQYRTKPALTLLSLWLSMRQDVLGDKQNEILFLPSLGNITIWSNRDPVRLQEAEMERLQAIRQGRAPGGSKP